MEYTFTQREEIRYDVLSRIQILFRLIDEKADPVEIEQEKRKLIEYVERI